MPVLWFQRNKEGGLNMSKETEDRIGKLKERIDMTIDKHIWISIVRDLITLHKRLKEMGIDMNKEVIEAYSMGYFYGMEGANKRLTTVLDAILEEADGDDE